jgi:hypothetical protein
MVLSFMTTSRGLASYVAEATRGLISLTERPEGIYVTFPIVLPGGQDAVLRVSQLEVGFRVTDFASGFAIADLAGTAETYLRLLRAEAAAKGFTVSGHEVMANAVSADQLPAALAGLSSLVHAALVQAVGTQPETKKSAKSLIDTLERAFGPGRVARHQNHIGASNHVWDFAATVLLDDRLIVSELATRNINSVAAVSLKMSDVKALDNAPGRLVMVKDKNEMGDLLVLLSQHAQVVDEQTDPEALRRAFG